MTDRPDLLKRFTELHLAGTFLMPNAWDIGSARILQHLGFEAIATTSSGFAATLGRLDQHVSLDEVVSHVDALASAVDIPLSVDAEHGYGDTPEEVATTVGRLAEAGAVGMSIEDYHPARGILSLDDAVERVAAAVAAAGRHGIVITARAENYFHGRHDLADTIERLLAYREAGADVLYAPWMVDASEIARLVAEVESPVNVLLVRNGPAVPELAEMGVRRVSTGGWLTFAAYGALARAADELLATGTSKYMDGVLSPERRSGAFGD